MKYHLLNARHIARKIKLDSTADEALKQIEEKSYANPYAMDSRKLYKTGINFLSGLISIFWVSP